MAPLFLTFAAQESIITTMILVLFPPGCYGTYVSRCLYNYTELSVDASVEFIFDKFGSSHVYRQNTPGVETVRPGHIEHYTNPQPDDKIITILTESAHYLDYIDNQLTKQSQGDFIEYITLLFGNNGWYDKLHSKWGVNSQQDIPNWTIRELMSFYLVDCLKDAYATQPYKKINSVFEITTSDVFNKFLQTLTDMANALNIRLKASADLIIKNHNEFLSKQIHHNIQLKCQQWVDDCINFKSAESPCKTIFDEAYAQHLLRAHGYEIQCTGLNEFPTDSSELRKIIYK